MVPMVVENPGKFLTLIVGKKGLESQGRNEVYEIRDQRPGKGRDYSPRDRDQQCASRDQQIFAGSGIKILIVFVIRGQHFVGKYGISYEKI